MRAGSPFRENAVPPPTSTGEKEPRLQLAADVVLALVFAIAIVWVMGGFR
jgi:hypothetical protein